MIKKAYDTIPPSAGLDPNLIEDHFPGQAPWTSAAQFCSDGFGDDPLFEAFIAERLGTPDHRHLRLEG